MGSLVARSHLLLSASSSIHIAMQKYGVDPAEKDTIKKYPQITAFQLDEFHGPAHCPNTEQEHMAEPKEPQQHHLRSASAATEPHPG